MGINKTLLGKMRTIYKQVHDGDIEEYEFEPFIHENGKKEKINAVEVYVACCDCGLVHRHIYWVEGEKLKKVSFRENRRTGQWRRYHHAKSL
jgi:hypothetical protein